MQQLKTDITIIGAGIVGLAIAIQLAKNNFNVVVCDQHFSGNIQKTNRLLALNFASEKLLRDTGVWQQIPDDQKTSYRNMLVWQGHHHITFNATDYYWPYLGCIVEQSILLEILLAAAKQQKNIQLIYPIQLKEIKEESNHITLIANQYHIHSKLMIGADGQNSWVREQANIPIEKNVFHQQAITANVTFEKSLQQTAWQHFSDQGIIGFLPYQQENQCGIVWSCSDTLAAPLIQLADQDFLQQLTDISEQRFGKAISVTHRQHFPLTQAHATAYVKSRIALVGDCAHVIHPLAGLGANLGFADGTLLCELLIDLHQQQRDYGLLAYIKHYERERKFKNQIIIAGTQFFNQIFNAKYAWIKNLAGFLLGQTNQLYPAKQIFAKVAAGDKPGKIYA